MHGPLAEAIHVAAMRHPKANKDDIDCPDAARMLIQLGNANVNAVNDNGDSALSFAIASGLDDVMRFLLTQPDIALGSTRPGVQTPAELAQKLGRIDAASLILHTQVNVVLPLVCSSVPQLVVCTLQQVRLKEQQRATAMQMGEAKVDEGCLSPPNRAKYVTLSELTNIRRDLW